MNSTRWMDLPVCALKRALGLVVDWLAAVDETTDLG